jgi:hypothetical protein
LLLGADADDVRRRDREHRLDAALAAVMAAEKNLSWACHAAGWRGSWVVGAIVVANV